MCKICSSCKSVMNYDPYFEAEICSNCGRMERKKKTNRASDDKWGNNIEIVRQIFGARAI